jgi:hypothetical protein
LFDGGIGYADRRIEAASAITSESARILTPIFGVFDPLSRPTLDFAKRMAIRRSDPC